MRMRFVFTIAVLGALALPAFSQVRLSDAYGDHMVLQRDRPIRVWGWASSGEKVWVTLAGPSTRRGSAVANADGIWTATLPALPAGGPYQLRFRGADGVLQTKGDVMMGDVWICSGQSNMQMSVASSLNADTEVPTSDYPKIRLFTVPNVSTESEQLEIPGASWQVCGPSTVGPFSAVAYYFGRHQFFATNVPIGLINTSWGGTPVESWTPRSELARNPWSARALEQYLKNSSNWEESQKNYERDFAEWQRKTFPNLDSSPMEAEATAETVDASQWKWMAVPGAIEPTMGDWDGSIWLRRTVRVPESWVGQDLTLNLGPIDDYDLTYFNGKRVGSTDASTPSWYAAPRSYRVPANLVKAGENVVAVRVYDTGGAGGILGPANLLELRQGSKSIPLSGRWMVRPEHKIDPSAVRNAPTKTVGPGDPWAPGSLFNAMIAPLVRTPIRGAIWYQGESNAGAPKAYASLFPLMIRSWRDRWGQGDFPFLFVQLAGWQPGGTSWAYLREAQTHTLLTTPKTGMAVAIDIGDETDIHPKNKQEVGRRLSLIALGKFMGKAVEYSGPFYKSMITRADEILLSFWHDDGLRTPDGMKLAGFEIAGSDRKFHAAEAKIAGNRVVVSSSAVPDPVAVRYGWNGWSDANLQNRSGLPASPFRTDDWDTGPDAGRTP